MQVFTWLSKFYILFATKFSCKFWLRIWDWFIMMPEIVSKLLLTAIWSSFAIPLESEHCEQTPISLKVLFRSAALHKRTCSFVTMPFFHSEANESKKDWLWLSKVKSNAWVNKFFWLTDSNSTEISFHNRKKSLVTTWNLQTIKTFWL